MASTPKSESPLGGGAPPGAEIRHLAALVAVAHERSFRAAARKLGTAQSALSRQVSELESAVGARLVIRAPRAVDARLTDAGRLMLGHAEAVLARVQAAFADLAAIGGAHPLRVGATDAIATTVLPVVLRRLRGIALESCEAHDDAQLLEGIERGSVDLTFAALPLPSGPFEWEEMLEDPYVLLVPRSWTLAERAGPIRESKLASMPLVDHPESPEVDHLQMRLRSRGRPLRIVRRAESDAGTRALVGAGVGAAIVPRSSVDPADLATAAIDLEPLLGHRTVALVWHRFRHLPVAATRFRRAAGLVGADLARRWHESDALEPLQP